MFFPDYLYSQIDRSSPSNKIFFLGSHHSGRLHKLNRLVKIIPDSFAIDFTLFGGRLNYFLDRILSKNNKIVRVKRIFKRLNHEDVLKDMAGSVAVIELNHYGQSGLTQRAAECVFLGIKLITDNKFITKYDFYNPQNIFVLNNKFDKADITEFLEKPYKAIDSNIVSKYSLSHWIKDVTWGGIDNEEESAHNRTLS